MIAIIFNKLEGKRYAKLYKEKHSDKFDFEFKVKAKDLKDDFNVIIPNQDKHICFYCQGMIDAGNTFRLAEITDKKGNKILGFDDLRYKCFEFVKIEGSIQDYEDEKAPDTPRTKPEPANVSYEKIEQYKKQFDNLMTGNELSVILGISKRSIYNFLKEGRIKGIKAGREWLFSKDNIEDFMKIAESRTIEKLNKRNNKKKKDQE